MKLFSNFALIINLNQFFIMSYPTYKTPSFASAFKVQTKPAVQVAATPTGSPIAPTKQSNTVRSAATTENPNPVRGINYRTAMSNTGFYLDRAAGRISDLPSESSAVASTTEPATSQPASYTSRNASMLGSDLSAPKEAAVQTPTQTFGQAYAAARKSGQPVFEWKGKKYAAESAQEAKARKEKTATPIAPTRPVEKAPMAAMSYLDRAHDRSIIKAGGANKGVAKATPTYHKAEK